MEIDTTPAGTDVDNDLEAEVTEAILTMDAMRSSAAVVQVHVRGGQVTLSGHVQSPMACVEVGRAAEAVPGVTSVINNLVDDGSLKRLLGEQLAADPTTCDIPPGYEVTATFGFVRVTGWFTPAQAEAVQAVIQATPGVRGVKVIVLD